MVQRVATVAFEGIEARAVDVQVQVAPGLPAFNMGGIINCEHELPAIGSRSSEQIRTPLSSFRTARGDDAYRLRSQIACDDDTGRSARALHRGPPTSSRVPGTESVIRT